MIINSKLYTLFDWISMDMNEQKSMKKSVYVHACILFTFVSDLTVREKRILLYHNLYFECRVYFIFDGSSRMYFFWEVKFVSAYGAVFKNHGQSRINGLF